MGASDVISSGEPEHTLQIRDPGDLLEAVPYLIGFHPERSLVLLGLAGNRVAITLRMDLSEAESGTAVSDTIAILRRTEVSAVLLVIYQDSPQPSGRGRALRPGVGLPGQQVVTRVADALRLAQLPVLESLLVCRGRWWSYDAAADGCDCCAMGQRLPGDTSPTAAAAVFAGMAARPNRRALQTVLDPEPHPDRDRQLVRIQAGEAARSAALARGELPRLQRSVKRELFAAARESDRTLIARESLTISDDRLCRYGVGLREIAVRDPVWLAIDQRRLDGQGLWHVLLRRLPSPYDCAPLFLFGWASWRDGNGALAAMAAERALASNPAYTAAELLLGAVRQGLDPHRTPRLRLPPRSARYRTTGRASA